MSTERKFATEWRDTNGRLRAAENCDVVQHIGDKFTTWSNCHFVVIDTRVRVTEQAIHRTHTIKEVNQ